MSFLTELFDLNGTSTRKQALRVFAVLLVAIGAVALIERFAPAYARFAIPVMGLLHVWWWATAVRRLHDAGRSGAWALVMLVPVLGIVLSLGVLLLRTDRPFNDSHAGLRLAGSLGLMLLALSLISRVFWAPYWIPSESMKPTLLIGDYLVVRHTQGDDLARGAVVVFRHPVNGSEMVARLIGLPGDLVQMQGGLVMLNDQMLLQDDAGVMREAYAPQGPWGILPRCTNAVVGLGGVCETQLHRETLPDGRNYLVANIENRAFADDIGPFTVPPGQMFLLGDNRDNSADSRFAQGVGGMGFVPVENVIGQGTRVIFSAAGSSPWAVWDWRADRIFRSVE